MLINGIETDDLADDDFALPAKGEGRTLLIDGDGPAYVAAATVKTVATGLRRFQSNILEQIFLANCADGHVYLTHEECTKAGRFNILGVKPYQGQRSGSAKPPLLAQVREIAHQQGSMDEFEVHMETQVEADDAMMMKSYVLGEAGIIRSDDKDLRMTIFPYYEIERGVVMPSDPFGELWMSETNSGVKKCLGRSVKFFWAQMVMGDTADNIKGLISLSGRTVGPSGAYNLLHPLRDIEAVCNTVIDAYREINQNPLPEAWMLWLLRHPGDNAWVYFNELPWSPANKAYLAECVQRRWFK